MIFDLETLEKPITARCAPLQDRNITVRWLPDQRASQGAIYNGDSVTFAWAAAAVVQGKTSRAAGYATTAHTLVAYVRAANVRGVGGGYWIIRQLRQLLLGNPIEGQLLSYMGHEMTDPVERDPAYRYTVQFQLVVNESVDRHA